MIQVTQAQIDKVNSLQTNEYAEQGIWVQPYGIPTEVKGKVVYSRYSPGGISGGSCWDDSNPTPYTTYSPNLRFQILDDLLNEIAPGISYLKYKQIESLIESNTETAWEYYGNSTDWEIQYIELDKLIDILNK